MNTDEMHKFGTDGMDVAMKSFDAWTKNAQAIATEVADYSKKSFEESAAVWEKLMATKSLEKAVEVQSDYLKSSYEDLLTEATRLGKLYTDFAEQAYKPFEAVLGTSR
jgi:hypothetical protein